MAADYRQLTTFLAELGIEQVRHTQRNYFAHLVAVYQLMRTYDQDEDRCVGGLFHSIYGTEKFQGFKLGLDRRPELTQLIGPRAEQLAFWNCFMDRASFDTLLGQHSDGYEIRNRESGELMRLTEGEYDDLCSVHLFDWLEQVPRSSFGWNYRRLAYRQMAERVGARAADAYREVFARESLT